MQGILVFREEIRYTHEVRALIISLFLTAGIWCQQWPTYSSSAAKRPYWPMVVGTPPAKIPTLFPGWDSSAWKAPPVSSELAPSSTTARNSSANRWGISSMKTISSSSERMRNGRIDPLLPPKTDTIRSHSHGMLREKFTAFNDPLSGELLKHGVYRKWDDSGRLWLESEWRDGRRQGFERIYFPDGKIAEEAWFVQGRQEGTHVWFNKHGQKIHQAEFKEDRLHGTDREWAPHGTLVREVQMQGGLWHGMATTWHSSGKKSTEGYFQKGLREGLHLAWDSLGRLSQASNWEHGLAHGSLTVYFPSGKKVSESQWFKGKKHGLEASWYPDGKKQAERQWEHGVLNSAREWNRSGILVRSD